MAPGTSAMLRARRRDVNVKPNRRLDRSSTRGMIYENEELRLRTINISAEVERSQDDVKKLRRENDQLRRELWGLRDEYDKLEALLKAKEQGEESEEYSAEEDEEDEGEDEEGEEEEGEGDDGTAAGGQDQQTQVQAHGHAALEGGAGAAASPSAGPAFRDRQVDFDMLSVVQEETENDQTDSQTGGEDQGASPLTPRKKGVCFMLEPLQPLPEHQVAPAVAPASQQPLEQSEAAQAAPLVCDQYLVGADGKPLRGAAGEFLTTADLARDPFSYPGAYGFATGTVVGGVLLPAVDPASGVPVTGLFPQEGYLQPGPGGEVAALGFDGLASTTAAVPDATTWPTSQWTRADVEPRGAPDLFVDGAYPAEGAADADLERLLRNINLRVANVTDATDASDRCDEVEAAEEGVLVALTGVPAGVADGVVLAALSQLGAVVGGIRRLGGPAGQRGPRDGVAAGDGDPGGGDGPALVARLLPWGQSPADLAASLPTRIAVAGTLAELRPLSDQEAALLDLSDFETQDMRDKSLRGSSTSAIHDKPFRSQIQVRLRHPAGLRGPGGPRAAVAPSPPPGRRVVASALASATLPASASRLDAPCALGPPAPPAPPPPSGATPGSQQALRPRLLGPLGPVAPIQAHTLPGYTTGTLRRPSTPFPVTVLRPLHHLPVRPAGPAGPALSGADLPVVAMPVPLTVNGRVAAPTQPATGDHPTTAGTAATPSLLASTPVTPAVVVAATPASDTAGPAASSTPAAPAASATNSPAAVAGTGGKPGPAGGQAVPSGPSGPQDSLGSSSSVNNDLAGERAERPQRLERSLTMESRLEAPSSMRSLPASPAASPAPSRRVAPGKRPLRKQGSAQSTHSLEEPTANGSALAPSPGVRRRAAKQKAQASHAEPSTPGGASSSGSTATAGTTTGKGLGPGGAAGPGGRPHAADVSQSSSSGQESPNKSERRRRVSILSRKPRRPPSPTDGVLADAILPAYGADHTTTASERERTNSASSRDSHVSAWRAAASGLASGRRRLSSMRRDSAERDARDGRDGRDSGKVPWCGCWGNGCL